MSATESRPPSPRPSAPRPPADPTPFSDEPTDRFPVVAPQGRFAANLPHQRTARRVVRPIDRPSPSLAGDLAALAFNPPSQLLRAIPAQRTPSAAESAA